MRRNGSVLWALLLIGIGVVLLLRNTGAIPKDVRIWPLVVMVIGAWLLVDRLFFGSRLGEGLVGPLVILAVGGVFFLQDVGSIDSDAALWPVIVIAVGVGLMLSAIPARRRGGEPFATTETIPLEGATEAKVRLNHGAGRLTVRSSLVGESLLEGTFTGGLERKVLHQGNRLDVTLSSRMGLPFRRWTRGRETGPFDWAVGLNRRVPLQLSLHTGANASEVDLTDLKVTDLELDTGASHTDLTLPSTGRLTARVKVGAAKVRITVPTRMAVRLEVHGGLSSVKVDQARFPQAAGVYRSPDFDTAEHRVELSIEAGAADVEVR